MSAHQPGSEFSRWGYPPVPAPGGDYEPSAPPLPPAEAHAYDIAAPPPKGAAAAAAGGAAVASTAPAPPAKQQRGKQKQQPPPAAVPPGVALVAPPKIEAQPWVKALWSGVKAGTIGIARVDLRRPTFPWPEEYDERNLLFKRRAPPAPRRGRPPTRAAAAAHAALGGPYYAEDVGGGAPGRGAPNGARLKVMRCIHLKAPEQRRPLVDLGVGLAVDLDRQSLHGVCRLKLGNFFSLKLAPQPTLKLGATWPLAKTGMALRFRYECPLQHLHEAWRPPARLMLRIDNDIGTGIHLSPTGIEFDERRMALGDTTELRAGATLRFPRSLPIDRDDPDAFKLQVHRLSLKTQW